MNSSFGLNSYHAHMFSSSSGSREQLGPQNELPISLSHGRTHYDLILDDAGKDVYLVRGRPDPWRYMRRGGRQQRSANNTDGSVVDSDSLLFAWRVRRDLESGRFFFSNCGGMGKKWRLPDYFDLGFQEEMQIFLLNNPTFGEQRSKQQQQQKDERTKKSVVSSRGEATTNIHVNHRDSGPHEKGVPRPYVSRESVEEKLSGSNREGFRALGTPTAPRPEWGERERESFLPTSTAALSANANTLSRSSHVRAPVSSAHDALSLSSSSLAHYHSQQPPAGTRESGFNYGSLRHDRQDLTRVDEQQALLTSQTHSTSSQVVVPAMLSSSSSSILIDRVNSHQKIKERNDSEQSLAREREEAERERIAAEAMLVAHLDAEREKSLKSVAADGRRAKEEEEFKEDESQPHTHQIIGKTPPMMTRGQNFPFNNDSRTTSTTAAAAAAVTAVTKDSSVAIDTLTSVVNSLQSLLDAERADRKHLEVKLREKDRILFERAMADAEAEESDIQLKLKIIEAIAIRRKEDAKMLRGVSLLSKDDNYTNTRSSNNDALRGHSSSHPSSTDIGTFSSGEGRSHTKEDTLLPATMRKKDPPSYSSANSTAEAKEIMETEDAYYY